MLGDGDGTYSVLLILARLSWSLDFLFQLLRWMGKTARINPNQKKFDHRRHIPLKKEQSSYTEQSDRLKTFRGSSLTFLLMHHTDFSLSYPLPDSPAVVKSIYSCRKLT